MILNVYYNPKTHEAGTVYIEAKDNPFLLASNFKGLRAKKVNAAIIIICADNGAIGQIREAACLVAAANIPKVVVLLNKADRVENCEILDRIKEYINVWTRRHYLGDPVPVISCSAVTELEHPYAVNTLFEELGTDVSIPTLLLSEEINKTLHDELPSWHVDTMDETPKEKRIVDSRTAFKHSTAIDVVSQLTRELIPPISFDQVDKLKTAIELAKRNPGDTLEEKQRFVAQVNRLLELHEWRLETPGGLCRLKVNPGATGAGFIQFAPSRGGSLGGFKNTEIKLVSISRPHLPKPS